MSLKVNQRQKKVLLSKSSDSKFNVKNIREAQCMLVQEGKINYMFRGNLGIVTNEENKEIINR